MNNWLICLPREDMEHCIRIGTFGLSRKHLLGRVEKGDKLVCCAGKGDWKIIGSGVAKSNYYLSDTKIFLKEGIFPDRFDFNAEVLPKSQEVDLMSIIEQLSFVTNVSFWAVYFRNGVAKLSSEDWQLIESAMNKSSVKKG